jgi:hypothetical protein
MIERECAMKYLGFITAMVLMSTILPAEESKVDIKNKILKDKINDLKEKRRLEAVNIKLGSWHSIGPFRDQPPLLNWMDNVADSFASKFEVEKDFNKGIGIANSQHYKLSTRKSVNLNKVYRAENFPTTPEATRKWRVNPEWVDGYYQELPRGPAPSAGESQYLYRTITVDKEVTAFIDIIVRAPESDRRFPNKKGMEPWRRTARYHWSLNGQEISRWEGRGDMPFAKKVTLQPGLNHLSIKITNNRHAYGFAFSIGGLHPRLRHEKGFEVPWQPFKKDEAGDNPYFSENKKPRVLSKAELYTSALKRLLALKFYPEPMPGVEHAVRDSQGRVVPAIEKSLAQYPTSAYGDRHTARLADLEKTVKPLLNKLINSADPLYDEVIEANDSLDKIWEQSISELPEIIFLERETYNYDTLQFTNVGSRKPKIRCFAPKTKKLRTIYDYKGRKESNSNVVRMHEFNLSYDAKTIYVGGGTPIHAIDSDGKNVRRIYYRGQSPCEMPDGRIVFFDDVKGQAPCKGRQPRRLLFIVDADGKNCKVVSANLQIDNSPSVMNDGRIIFARWDYGVNKNVFNRHALWVQNPDGTGIDLYFGNTVIDPRGFYRPKQIPGRPEVLTVFGPHHRNVAGLIGLVWNGNGREAADGLGFRRITHDTASVGDRAPSWSYQDPHPINEQLFLVSYGGQNDNIAALYLLDRSGNKKCILKTSSGIHSAQPFEARKKPRIIPDRTNTPNWVRGEDLHERLLTDPNWEQKSTMYLVDVYLGLEPEIKRGEIKYLAVMEQVPQTHPRGGAMAVGAMWYANRCVGLVPVEEDGSAHFEVPALRSLYFHVLDKDGKMLMTQGSDFHTMPGEKRSCIGCHEQRKGIDAPPQRSGLSLALKKKVVRPKMPKWGTNGIIEYEAVVQPVLNKYCVSCHSGAEPKAHLNLTGDRTSVYNMSYMELTDRMLVHFQPGTGHTHAQPTNDYDEQSPLSRGSVMSKLTSYIQDPKRCGQTIPREDQFKIFIWIDSNVPFYSHYRQKSPTLLKPEAKKSLLQTWKTRCASCHNQEGRSDTKSGLNAYHAYTHALENKPGDWGIADSGMRVRHLNLSNPANSAALQAPLAKASGGWGLCRTKEGKEIFSDKNDADYKAILEALKQVSHGDPNKVDFMGVKEILERRSKK